MIGYGIRYITNRIRHRFKQISFPVGFESSVKIKNAQFISIGKNVYFGSNVIIQIPEEHKQVSTDPEMIIGNHVTVGMGSMINAVKSISIGDNVLIAPHVFIADHIHKYKDINTPIRFQGIDKIAPVVIEEEAWICTHVTINPGITIGKHAVVGANSVVTKDVPPFSVALGSPAKVIKQYNFKTKVWENIK